jgi:glycosyltransferase involved in cell wall biosynthesis
MTENQMKVSVLLVTYNHEQYIAQAVESVLMQKTNFKYEILISEDCSTDNTRNIVLAFGEKYTDKIRLLLSEHNLCTNEVLARGMKAARGQYIAHLDGDDYWTSPYKLQKQADFLDAHPKCSICYHNVDVFHEDGDRQTYRSNPLDVQQNSTLEDLLWKGDLIESCSIMLRKVFDELPDWFRTIDLGDWALLILHAQRGKIGYINEVMGVYRIHGGGVWSKLSRVRRLEKEITFYEDINRHLNFVYDKRIKRIIIPELFSKLAMEYDEYGDTDKVIYYLKKYIANLPASYEEYPHDIGFHSVTDPRLLKRKLWSCRHPNLSLLAGNALHLLKCRMQKHGLLHEIEPMSNPVQSISSYEGHHDEADCDIIAGWAWDSARTDIPVKVDIYADNILLDTITADGFRKDLTDAGKGNGKHAFYYLTPLWLKDGKPHSIITRISGTNFNLGSTPKVINCSPEILEKSITSRLLKLLETI